LKCARMHLQRIEASNFRNLLGEIEFSPGLNVVYGANAQGKSSWLEAIYLLATTKSFRTSHPKEVITHEAHEAILRGSVPRANLPKDFNQVTPETQNQPHANGKRKPGPRSRGTPNATVSPAEEMRVVRGAPEPRRRFLDRGIFFTLPAYLGALNEYSRVLKQKNALLREASEAENQAKFQDLIQPWNDQLVALGSEIHQARVKHVDQLRAHLSPELFQAEEIPVRY